MGFCRNHRFFVLALTVVALVTAIFPKAVHAQGTLPRLITKKMLVGTQNRGYIRYLNLSDAQLAEIQRLHDEYAANWATSFNDDIARFNARWNAPFTNPHDFEGASMEEAFNEAQEAGERLKFKLRAANDLFFDQIEMILSEEQAFVMPRVRLAHDRYTYKRSHGNGLRERHVDVVELVEDMPLEGEDARAAATIISEYEPVVVAALRRAAELDQKRSQLQFQLLDVVRQYPKGEPIDDAGTAEMDRLRKAAGKVAYVAEKNLIEANRRFVNRLKESFSPSAAADLQRRFDEVAYPEVFPDQGLSIEVFGAAKALNGIADYQLTALNAFFDDYLREHTRLSRLMASKLYALSVTRYRAATPEFHEQAAKIIDEFVRLQNDRENLNRRQFAIVQTVLLPEQIALLPESVRAKKSPSELWNPRGAPIKRRQPASTAPGSE